VTQLHLQNNWFHLIQNIHIKADPHHRSTNPLLKKCILTMLLYRAHPAVLLHSDRWRYPLCCAHCHYMMQAQCTLEAGGHYYISGSELWMILTLRCFRRLHKEHVI